MLNNRITKLERLLEISKNLSSIHDLNTLLQHIVEVACDLIQSEASSILLYDPSTHTLEFVAAPWFQLDKLKNIRVPIDSSIAGWVYTHAEPITIDNVKADKRFYSKIDKLIQYKTNNMVAVPLMLRETPIGVLEGVNKTNGDTFTDEDIYLLSILASHAAVAIQNSQLLTRFQKANEELSELDKQKSNFIAIASHELRTPLGVILGHATYLSELVDDEFKPHIEAILNNAEKLKQIIEDLGNMDNLESGKARLRLNNIDLGKLLQQVLQKYYPAAQQKDIAIKSSLPATGVLIFADEQKLGIALSNIIKNAITFTNPGGKIFINHQMMEDKIRLSIIDTGIGIPESDLERIFDRFYQVEGHLTRRYGGMGLGLSVAKLNIELHGGRIWAESVLGKGSNFTLELPISPSPDANLSIGV